MTISLLFSLVLYDVSQNEIKDGLRRQLPYLQEMQPYLSNATLLALERKEEHSALIRLQARLLLINLGILLAAGAGSWWQARRSLKPIEDAMEAQSRFTADASHELRTPLTAMKAEIEVALRDKRLSIDEARELLGSNLEEVAKLEALANGLLRLAQHDHSATASTEAVALTLIVTGAIARKGSNAEKRSITIINNVGVQTIMGDREHMIELVAILLDNAIKYSPDNSNVTISSGKTKSTAWLEVCDEGPGITAADMPYIFERFYRADQARTHSQAGGYGLGLSIARQIAKLYNGSIDAVSKPGEGATFTVRLPLAPNPPQAL